MAAYKVGVTSTGEAVWWPHWQLPHGLPNAECVRDATDAEAALMNKIVWDRDTPDDIDELKRMINRPERAHDE